MGNSHAILVLKVNGKNICFYFQITSISCCVAQACAKTEIQSVSLRDGVSSPLWTEPNTWKAFKHVVLLLVGGGHLFHITRTKKLLSVWLTAYKWLSYCPLLPVILSLLPCICCCQGNHSSLKMISFLLMFKCFMKYSYSMCTAEALSRFWFVLFFSRISFLKLMNYGTGSQSSRMKNYSTKRNLSPLRWVLMKTLFTKLSTATVVTCLHTLLFLS